MARTLLTTTDFEADAVEQHRPAWHGFCSLTNNSKHSFKWTFQGDDDMSTITLKDGTTIYYKDWGKGPVVTFSHGWPLSSDAWDGQMQFLAQHGFRVVAHDRRGHGRKKFNVPTLVLHGEDDQIVPVKDSARKSARLIKGAKEIYYPGAPHGLTATHQDQFNADLLAFLRS
jgi:pimeloyl-ACP methyl ester carboxylesterase